MAPAAAARKDRVAARVCRRTTPCFGPGGFGHWVGEVCAGAASLSVKITKLQQCNICVAKKLNLIRCSQSDLQGQSLCCLPTTSLAGSVDRKPDCRRFLEEIRNASAISN